MDQIWVMFDVLLKIALYLFLLALLCDFIWLLIRGLIFTLSSIWYKSFWEPEEVSLRELGIASKVLRWWG